jgi:putative membrane protein insertion efficiency factor
LRIRDGLKHHRNLKQLRPSLLAVVFIAALAADAARSPAHQFTARGYVLAVDAYHAWVHPITARYVRCRFNPSCSHYSIEAVKRYGICRGLALTTARLARCRTSVPFGTDDPVP